MDRIEEIEALRAARKAAAAEAQKEQYAKDLEALNALEIEHGDGSVAYLEVDRFVKGHPTMVILKSPSGAQYKRFCDQVGKSVEKNNMASRRAAQDMLAESCWKYPEDPEARKAMLEEFPGLLVSIAVKAASLVEAKAKEEGKD